MENEDSDEDWKGALVAPLEHYLGFSEKFEQHKRRKPDLAIYEVRKFFRLAANCNPNIIEVLWSNTFKVVTPEGRKIIEARDSFLSRRAYNTFRGYAHQEMGKLGRRTGNWKGKRLGKHAMNVVRLLRMGAEILGAGEVRVKREDREELLSIRDGAWSIEKIADFMKESEEKLRTLNDKSPLPKEPDMGLLNRLCQDTVRRFHDITKPKYVERPKLDKATED